MPTLFKSLFKGALIGAGGVVLAVALDALGAPAWGVIAILLFTVLGTALGVIRSFNAWYKGHSAPKLSFSEFGFLYEAWKADKHGGRSVFADTPSHRRLVELGLIRVVKVEAPHHPFGLPVPFIMTFAAITPLGEKVLLQSVREDSGEQAAKDMEAWQPPPLENDD